MTRSIRLLAMLIALGAAFPIRAQQSPVSWRLDHVTCHEVGALLTFEGSLQSAGGELEVMLSDLPMDAEVSSAQVELPEGFELISIVKSQPLPNLDKELSALERTVEAQRLALELERALVLALDQERAFLEANRSIGGGGEVLLVDDVEEMRQYIADKHRMLALDRVDLVSQVRALERQLLQAERDLEALRVDANRPSHALLLKLSGKGSGMLRVRVATQLAGWASSYDVSWDEKSGKLIVEQFARLVQNTGVDWNQVSLEFRTGQPMSLGSDSPPRPQMKTLSPMASQAYCANVRWLNSGLSDVAAKQEVLSGQGVYASNWSQTAGPRVHVKGDGSASRIWLGVHELHATPTWTAIPSRHEMSLRTCHTKGWMDARFLSGESRVFQGSSMVGELPLNMPPWGDSLVVQLGLDDGVHAEVKLLQDESGTRRFSGKRVIEQVRLVEVHNAESTPSTVNVVEHLPSGSEYDMEVQVQGGGQWDPETGEVTWTGVELPVSGVWSAQLTIRMVVPRGVPLSGL